MPPKVDLPAGDPDASTASKSADSPRQATARVRTYTTLGKASPLVSRGGRTGSPRASIPDPSKIEEGDLTDSDLQSAVQPGLLEKTIELTKGADGKAGFGWMGGIVGSVSSDDATAAGLECGQRIKRINDKTIEEDDANDELTPAINAVPAGAAFSLCIEQSELDLCYNDLFHHCENSQRRPAERVMLGNMKGYTERESWEYFRSNPQHCVAVCSDISDYSECFWNFKHNRYCTPDEAEFFDRILEALFNSKGSFLDEPISEKISEFFPTATNGLVAAATTMQGWRTDNEDAHICCQAIPSHANVGCFAVLDGHGGRRVSRFAAARLLDDLGPLLPADVNAEGVKKGMYDGVLAVDAGIEKDMKEEQIGTTGTTLNMVLITPTDIITANVGDSRAVLATKNAPDGCKPLSVDHKPGDEAEKERIEKAGSNVQDGRVDGMLAVSRALGDFDFKQASAMPPEKQAVSCAPDITIHARDTANDEFMLQACDGIWDCMSSAQACDFIRKALAEGSTPVAAIESLCQHCLAEGLEEHGIGSDNMTVNLAIFK